MKRESVDLPKEKRAILEECASGLPAGFPLSRETSLKILKEACRASGLDARTVCSRFLWLVDPGKAERIHLLEYFPGLGVEEIAKAIISPRKKVLAIIGKKSGLDEAFLLRIYEEIATKGNSEDLGQIADLAEERVLQEMKWWLTDLSFPEYYLRNTPPALIARQIMLNRSYELAGMDSEAYERMRVSSTAPDGTTMHWVHRKRSLKVEEEIEREYYQGNMLFNVTSHAPIEDLLLYTVYKSPATHDGECFEAVAPRSFLEMSDAEARRRYEHVWNTVLSTGNIVIEHTHKQETAENRVMIGFLRGTINHFQANVSRVMRRADIEVTRKYTATFGGGRPVIIASLYSKQAFPQDLLRQLVEVSLYPAGPFAALVEKGALTPAQANFMHAATLFVHQFISVPDPDVGLLSERFRDDHELAGVLRTLQTKIDRDTFPQDVIVSVFVDRPDIARELYGLFSARFDRLRSRARGGGQGVPCPPEGEAAARERLKGILSSSLLTGDEAEIVRWGIRFIDAIVRTNFFLPVKGALSFRLDSCFFARPDLESVPFGVFFVTGRDFHGFHVRFKDIARGGIRIVRSATLDDWLRNSDSLFEECFNLAYTQNKKNKDIPEGGSKGIILPPFKVGDAEAEQAFHQYVDALLDLLLPEHSEQIVGWEEEILFLGPDEGTAHLMDWASQRARVRSYRYWKGFTTGKDASLGGISHKEYGMTTQGVHRYVLGILKKLGIAEESITKAQTGGPDGDLGSNEVLISRDRTTVIIDGGGVLYDPDGLDREELARLVRLGDRSSAFDEKKLSPKGFKVQVSDRDKKLPDGTVVASGLGFRNTFHLDHRMKADLFVPCGGRPRSINLNNWRSLLDENGEPIFRWIVEGANLFITQEARLKLEEKGVILFMDSSTNKGGVISSSLEVLAGLALNDEEYDALMTVRPGGEVPAFRARYVQQVIVIITNRADLEFELLWKTHEERGIPISELSETVSAKINEITRAVEESTLFDNEAVRRSAFRQHVPASLIERVGMDAILSRVPQSYQKAILARSLASSFIYRYGVEAGFEDYRRYVEELARG